MNAQQFLTWMRNPGQTSREESAQLDALLDSFPYFQSGHLLYIKNLHNQGSFLYNNQLKTAAAYAVNRKVLYQLITLKPGDGSVETGVQLDSRTVEQSNSRTVGQSNSRTVGQSNSRAVEQTGSQKVEQSDSQKKVEQPVVDFVRDDNATESKTGVAEEQEKHTASEEQVSVPPQFPPKKFTSNPDEWEAGMLRQLQLLHHWQQTGDDKREVVQPGDGSEKSTQENKQPEDPQAVSAGTETSLPTEEPVADPVLPDAKEEINTLLYVLVEPGQSEDIAEEIGEEISTDVVTDENEPTQWEIKIAEEEKPEHETPIAVPSDLVQKEIMVEAIHSTFELEVDDRIPSVEELKVNTQQLGSQQSFAEEPKSRPSSLDSANTEQEKATEEVVVTGMEMSFSQWLQEVGKAEVSKSEAGKSEVNKSEAGKSEVNKTDGDQSEAVINTEPAKKTPSELPKTALSSDVLVEQFIKDEPRINVKKSGFYNPVNMAKKSVQESDEFITETLARIYAKQGNTVKAVRAYQKLSLKFPEKTAYFAALIEELKRTPNK